MVRPLRLEFPGAVYHITARGNARQNIFLDDADRHRFLSLFAREVGQQGWRCYAYCLMDNHYHLFIETPEGNLVTGMRRLNGVYTQSFNRRHGKVGHLFQGRYHSVLVDRDNYLLELCRYMVLNPVRAKIVDKAADWPWSSYRATVGKIQPPNWLAVDWVLGQFGRSRVSARQAYKRFVTEGLDVASPWSELRGQIWLGGETFLARMERLAAGSPLEEVSDVQAHPARPTREDVLQAVGEVYDMDTKAITSRIHQEAYKGAVYLLRRVANVPLKEVANLFNVSPSRISQIQKQAKAGRFDKKIVRLLKRYKVKN